MTHPVKRVAPGLGPLESNPRDSQPSPAYLGSGTAMGTYLEGIEDIICNKFSISMGGKTLFKDSKLSLIHGRRYGLIGARPACRQSAWRLAARC